MLDVYTAVKRSTFVSGMGTLCALARPLAARAAGTPAVIHAASSIDDDATPFIYAMQSGLFRRYDIDADLQRSTSGAASVAGVLGGTFQIAKSSVTSLSAAHARGLPLTWIAPAGEYDSKLPQVIGLIVRADGPIKTAADLNGKTVGVSAIDDVFTLACTRLDRRHGGDSSTIKLTEMPMSQTRARRPKPAASTPASSSNRFSSAATGRRKVRVIGDPISGIGGHFMQSAWFTSGDFAAKNPDAIDRFIRAMREASTYVNAPSRGNRRPALKVHEGRRRAARRRAFRSACASTRRRFSR